MDQNEDRALIEVPVIADDNIVAIARAAEGRIAAINKIKQLALRVTNEHDWVDQNGKPYLMASGAEKVARLFGMSWQIDEPQFTLEEDGHFAYTYKGCFSLGGVSIEAIGTRTSKDGFFNRYEYEGKEKTLLPPSAIDKGDVKKAAYTNLIGNGVTRLLGIRNLTWEDVKRGGIEVGEVTKVKYKKEGEERDIRQETHEMLIKLYGKEYGPDLEKLSGFTASDGNVIPGVKSLERISEKRLYVIYGKVKGLHEKLSPPAGEDLGLDPTQSGPAEEDEFEKKVPFDPEPDPKVEYRGRDKIFEAKVAHLKSKLAATGIKGYDEAWWKTFLGRFGVLEITEVRTDDQAGFLEALTIEKDEALELVKAKK